MTLSPVTSGLRGQMWHSNTSKRLGMDRGFSQAWKSKHAFEFCLPKKNPTTVHCVTILMPLLDSRCPRVSQVPPDATSSNTGGTHSTGWEIRVWIHSVTHLDSFQWDIQKCTQLPLSVTTSQLYMTNEETGGTPIGKHFQDTAPYEIISHISEKRGEKSTLRDGSFIS